MTNSNPYQAPSSNVASTAASDTYQPKILATKGRLGRLRYLAYGLLSYIVFIPILLLLGALTGDIEGNQINDNAVIGALTGVLYICIIAYSFVLAKRRFNDLDKSGWLSVLMIVPFVNIVAGLFLMFAPGTKTENRFGAVPTPNTLIVKIGGFIFPIIFLGSMLAAIALPAYQNYVTRINQGPGSTN